MCCRTFSFSGLNWSLRAEATRLYMRPFLAAATAKFLRLIWYPLRVTVSEGKRTYVYVCAAQMR